jgi:hypothetical protein
MKDAPGGVNGDLRYPRKVAILYGDGSPSVLEIDYLGYLRRAMAMAVEVALVEDQLVAVARQRAALQRRTGELEGRLEALRLTVRAAVGTVARSPEDDPVTHCANHIEGEVDAVVARAAAGVRAQHEAAAAAIAARERTIYATCLEAIESFLRDHDLPGASTELDRETAGRRTTELLRATTPYRVEYELELEAQRRRKKLRVITLDDVPLEEHDRPTLLIDRIFAAMAPEVRTIVERSRVPGELSLRRETGKDRREEIFVTYATLLEVVAQVPVARRRHFDVLGIPGLASARPPTVDGVELSEPSIQIDVDD